MNRNWNEINQRTINPFSLARFSPGFEATFRDTMFFFKLPSCHPVRSVLINANYMMVRPYTVPRLFFVYIDVMLNSLDEIYCERFAYGNISDQFYEFNLSSVVQWSAIKGCFS